MSKFQHAMNVVKLDGRAQLNYLVKHFGMTYEDAVKTMIDNNQDMDFLKIGEFEDV